MHTSETCLYHNSELLAHKAKKMTSFPKRTKYLGINLTCEMKDLNRELGNSSIKKQRFIDK